jgi:exoribonuclease-2
MTHVPFVTIDGESTKDMDDALYAETLDNGDFKLMIAIADPTAYIAPDAPMDKEARKRGFTIYLPGRNIPMLPRELADDLCSLVEDHVRPAICCSVTISDQGVIADDITFFAANIKSHARLSYGTVSDWLEESSNNPFEPNAEISPVLTSLYHLSRARIQWRSVNAVIFNDKPDYHFELDVDNDVTAIRKESRRSAHKLVEEAMITANICAGRILKQQFSTGIFNTHSGFKPERIKELLTIIDQETDLSFTEESIRSLAGFSQLRRWLNKQPTSYLDNRLRKFQSYGGITNEPAEHFAMGLDIYATWTSPIRKYGDMINHRLLKAYICGIPPNQIPDNEIGDELNIHRKHHKIAERSVADWLYARTLANEPKKETKFIGEIFDINRAGMRLQIIENGATVFVPSSLIESNKERIECNSESGTVSIDNDHVYKLGDVLEIVLQEVNLENRNIIAKPANEVAKDR